MRVIGPHKIERVLDSVATEVTSCTPEMSRKARGEEPLFKNGIRRSLVSAARRYPEQLHRLYDKVALEEGYHRIAGGNQNIVVTNGRHAIKIDRKSLDMSMEERSENAKAKDELFERGYLYMSRFLIDQVVEVQAPPLKGARQAVITKQPLVNIAVHDLAESTPETVSHRLQQSGIPSELVGAQLEIFCTQSKALERNEGLLPDIGGLGNLVVSREGQLVLIDSYMTTPDHRERPSIRPGFNTIAEEHDSILRQMQDLCQDLLCEN